MRAPIAIQQRHVPLLLEAFGLGTRGRLSDRPVAEGRVGSIWRLDTDRGSWAVKPVSGVPGDADTADADTADTADTAALERSATFQEAARRGGVPTPAVLQTRDAHFVGDLGDVRVMVQAWVDLRDPDLGLDPPALGRLLAALHRVEDVPVDGLDPWFAAPVGADTWASLIADLRACGAPFADELAELVPGIVDVESLLGRPPRSVRTCHRDLWADNLRATADGGLCVIDFDNAGLADPAQELAMVVAEFGDRDPGRARALRAAYEAAGGPGRITGPEDFAMPIATLGHIVETGCRRWLAATTDEERADNEGWVREYIDRPLHRDAIERLL